MLQWEARKVSHFWKITEQKIGPRGVKVIVCQKRSSRKTVRFSDMYGRKRASDFLYDHNWLGYEILGSISQEMSLRA